MAGSPPVLSVRMSPAERSLIELAAEQAHTTLSEFARHRLVEAAELELLMPRPVTIAAKDWERFEAWAHEPPRAIPELSRLAAARPAWES